MIRRTLLRIGEATNFGPEEIVDNRDSFTAVEGLVVFGLGLLLAEFLTAHRRRCLPLAGRVIAACYPSAMTPGQDLSLPTLPNLRDIGGYRTNSGGTVRTGFLYRSTALDRLAGDDIATFDSLGVQSVFDFRTEAERSAEPDRLPSGVRGIVLDVLKDSSDAAPAQLFSILADPRAATELLGDGKAIQLFDRGYRELVTLPSALDAYGKFFTAIARSQARPALFHCTTGKDRTGWAAAATLLLLGVSEADVESDYLLTNRDLLPALQPVFDRFESLGGDPDLLRPVLGVEIEYLHASLGEMRKAYGTIEQYFSDGLRIGPEDQDSLRQALIL